MIFDVFFSICQTEVGGYTPTEKVMFQNFFDEVMHADALGFCTAWIAESHLSTEVQKSFPHAVVPHFKGEIGLNTDVFQMASHVFKRTRSIHVGSAIRSIHCNGGPMAHAEATRMFLALHGLEERESRKIFLGFAAGRFEFSSQPYGVFPRDEIEKAAWPVVKGKIFREATEIFLRFLRGDVFSSDDVTSQFLERKDFRSEADWEKVSRLSPSHEKTPLNPRWKFQRSGLIPREYRKELLSLFIGTHDPATQVFANTILPCGVFNVSITPGHEIEETHQRMLSAYHRDGGKWSRTLMPRTVLVFVDENRRRAQEHCFEAVKTYWQAMEGTLDSKKVENAVSNALVGDASEVRDQMQKRFHPEDRLMLWFDLNNHDANHVKKTMSLFMDKIAPHVS